ncbi:MAG TPA: LysR substrate-binding domain-containing protein [Hyphomicrobium sp.]|nr:LysR substrate-binding domain-containing protein [Hyphomicrobium sp.]
MDKVRAMTMFAAVAEAGSLSAAARHLGEPLTNVSRALAQIEDRLSCTLIERTTRRMVLTEAGRDYLETCRRVIDQIEAAESRITGEAGDLSGALAITAPVAFGRLHVVPVLAAFLASFPRIDARLLLMDRVVDLIDEGIDVAVRIGALPASALIALRVGTLKMVACASPDYLDRHGVPSAVADLTGRDCITFDGLPGGTRWNFKSKRHGSKSVRIRARLSVNSAGAALDAAAAGAGITRVLSYQAKAALDAGRVRSVLDRFDDTAIPVHLVYRPTRSDSPRVREFVRFAASRLRASPALR